MRWLIFSLDGGSYQDDWPKWQKTMTYNFSEVVELFKSWKQLNEILKLDSLNSEKIGNPEIPEILWLWMRGMPFGIWKIPDWNPVVLTIWYLAFSGKFYKLITLKLGTVICIDYWDFSQRHHVVFDKWKKKIPPLLEF